MLTEDAFNELTAKIARLRDERAKLIEEVATLRADQEVMTAQLERQAAEIETLRDSISRMGDAAFKLRDTVAALNAKTDAAPAPVENAATVEINVFDWVKIRGLDGQVRKIEGDVITVAFYGVDAAHYHHYTREEIALAKALSPKK